jgi:TrmH family RNA methyltransferase
VRSLAERGARRESGLFVAEGGKLVEEIVHSHMRVRTVYSTEQIAYPGVECRRATSQQMERMSHLRTPTGLLALVEIPDHVFDPATFGRGSTLALDGVQDPGNMGTIIRLADWFGVGDVICSPQCADCFNPKVVQATMGAIIRVRVHYGELRQWLSMAGSTPVYGTFMDGEEIFTAPLSPDGIIVMGSEGRGISPEAENYITRRLTIPGFPPGRQTSESLNVATATAITLAEFRRRGLE